MSSHSAVQMTSAVITVFVFENPLAICGALFHLREDGGRPPD